MGTNLNTKLHYYWYSSSS